MRPLLKRVVLFVLIFSAILLFDNSKNTVSASDISTDNLELIEAIENIKFYSSYNYQTLTEDKLNQLTLDFYLPVQYGNVSVDWQLDSDYLDLSEHSESIEIHAVSGMVPVDVVKVSILKQPNIIKGDQSFEIIGTFSVDNHSTTMSYFGTIIPIIPDSFFGGVSYTFIRYFSLFLEGALTTIGISLAGTLIGFILALFIASGKIIKPHEADSKSIKFVKTFIQKVSSLYIVVFRGTPMIVQASFFWYGLGLFGNALLCGLFVVSLNTAAYIAEIIRGGVLSIDDGQTEAAKSLGMSSTQTLLLIIFPQAIKHSMPAIGNEFVINIKDTAVLSVIGIFELFNQTRKIAGMHYRQLESYFVVALIYLCLTYTVTSILKYVEKRFELPHKELTSSN